MAADVTEQRFDNLGQPSDEEGEDGGREEGEEGEEVASKFTPSEMRVLIREVKKRKEGLFGDYKTGESAKSRWLIWQEVAEKVNEVSPTHRNLEQVRLKWFEFKNPNGMKKIEKTYYKRKHPPNTGMFLKRGGVMDTWPETISLCIPKRKAKENSAPKRRYRRRVVQTPKVTSTQKSPTVPSVASSLAKNDPPDSQLNPSTPNARPRISEGKEVIVEDMPVTDLDPITVNDGNTLVKIMPFSRKRILEITRKPENEIPSKKIEKTVDQWVEDIERQAKLERMRKLWEDDPKPVVQDTKRTYTAPEVADEIPSKKIEQTVDKWVEDIERQAKLERMRKLWEDDSKPVVPDIKRTYTAPSGVADEIPSKKIEQTVDKWVEDIERQAKLERMRKLWEDDPKPVVPDIKRTYTAPSGVADASLTCKRRLEGSYNHDERLSQGSGLDNSVRKVGDDTDDFQVITEIIRKKPVVPQNDKGGIFYVRQGEILPSPSKTTVEVVVAGTVGTQVENLNERDKIKMHSNQIVIEDLAVMKAYPKLPTTVHDAEGRPRVLSSQVLKEGTEMILKGAVTAEEMKLKGVVSAYKEKELPCNQETEPQDDSTAEYPTADMIAEKVIRINENTPVASCNLDETIKKTSDELIAKDPVTGKEIKLKKVLPGQGKSDGGHVVISAVSGLAASNQIVIKQHITRKEVTVKKVVDEVVMKPVVFACPSGQFVKDGAPNVVMHQPMSSNNLVYDKDVIPGNSPSLAGVSGAVPIGNKHSVAVRLDGKHPVLLKNVTIGMIDPPAVTRAPNQPATIAESKRVINIPLLVKKVVPETVNAVKNTVVFSSPSNAAVKLNLPNEIFGACTGVEEMPTKTIASKEVSATIPVALTDLVSQPVKKITPEEIVVRYPITGHGVTIKKINQAQGERPRTHPVNGASYKPVIEHTAMTGNVSAERDTAQNESAEKHISYSIPDKVVNNEADEDIEVEHVLICNQVMDNELAEKRAVPIKEKLMKRPFIISPLSVQPEKRDKLDSIIIKLTGNQVIVKKMFSNGESGLRNPLIATHPTIRCIGSNESMPSNKAVVNVVGRMEGSVGKLVNLSNQTISKGLSVGETVVGNMQVAKEVGIIKVIPVKVNLAAKPVDVTSQQVNRNTSGVVVVKHPETGEEMRIRKRITSTGDILLKVLSSTGEAEMQVETGKTAKAAINRPVIRTFVAKEDKPLVKKVPEEPDRSNANSSPVLEDSSGNVLAEIGGMLTNQPVQSSEVTDAAKCGYPSDKEHTVVNCVVEPSEIAVEPSEIAAVPIGNVMQRRMTNFISGSRKFSSMLKKLMLRTCPKMVSTFLDDGSSSPFPYEDLSDTVSGSSENLDLSSIENHSRKAVKGGIDRIGSKNGVGGGSVGDNFDRMKKNIRGKDCGAPNIELMVSEESTNGSEVFEGPLPEQPRESRPRQDERRGSEGSHWLDKLVADLGETEVSKVDEQLRATNKGVIATLGEESRTGLKRGSEVGAESSVEESSVESCQKRFKLDGGTLPQEPEKTNGIGSDCVIKEEFTKALEGKLSKEIKGTDSKMFQTDKGKRAMTLRSVKEEAVGVVENNLKGNVPQTSAESSSGSEQTSKDMPSSGSSGAVADQGHRSVPNRDAVTEIEMECTAEKELRSENLQQKPEKRMTRSTTVSIKKDVLISAAVKEAESLHPLVRAALIGEPIHFEAELGKVEMNSSEVVKETQSKGKGDGEVATPQVNEDSTKGGETSKILDSSKDGEVSRASAESDERVDGAESSSRIRSGCPADTCNTEGAVEGVLAAKDGSWWDKSHRRYFDDKNKSVKGDNGATSRGRIEDEDTVGKRRGTKRIGSKRSRTAPSGAVHAGYSENFGSTIISCSSSCSGASPAIETDYVLLPGVTSTECVVVPVLHPNLPGLTFIHPDEPCAEEEVVTQELESAKVEVKELLGQVKKGKKVVRRKGVKE